MNRFLLATAVAVICVLRFVSCQMTELTTCQLDRIRIENRQYIDSYGRVRIFHGINVDNKSEPYIPNYLSAEQIDTMANKWGFNIVRFNFAWEGFEFKFAQKSNSYLDAFESLVSQYAGYGIYVNLDIHQDQYSQNWCGEGFPQWAAVVTPGYEIEEPFPLGESGYYDPYPVNTSNPYGGIEQNYCISIGNNGEYYFSAVTNNIFANFYANEKVPGTNVGVQDQFISIFPSIDQRFGTNPNVFSYEIINEPFPGSIFANLELFTNSTYGDLTLLQPLYDKVSNSIRPYNRVTPLMFEPLVTNGEVLARQAGFSHAPGGNVFADLGILAFHSYCDVTAEYADDCYLAGPVYAEQCAQIAAGDPNYCFDLFEAQFAVRTADSIKLGVPIFVSEFGSYESNQTLNSIYLNFIANQADVNFTSWTVWDILYLLEYPVLIPSVVRTYAQAIAGIPVSQSFDINTLVFVLSFEVVTSINAPTIIFVPTEIHYPNGFVVETSTPLLYVSYPDQNFLEITPSSKLKSHKLVTITITPYSNYRRHNSKTIKVFGHNTY